MKNAQKYSVLVEQLLNETHLNIFVYNGQLDLIVDTPGKLICFFFYVLQYIMNNANIVNTNKIICKKILWNKLTLKHIIAILNINDENMLWWIKIFQVKSKIISSI